MPKTIQNSYKEPMSYIDTTMTLLKCTNLHKNELLLNNINFKFDFGAFHACADFN